MESLELIERIGRGEDSYTQFKREAIKSSELAKELVAFSNAEGGVILFGVADNGDIMGLSPSEVERLGQLIGNTANENVKPPIHPLIENIMVENKLLMIVKISKGNSKPYMTSSGDYYIKSSSDKKKLSQDELRRLFAESQRLYADEEIVNGSDISDVNSELFFRFLEKDNPKILKGLQEERLNLQTILNNYNLMKGDNLTLAGNLLFGINPRKFHPMFFIDCCYFTDDYISSNDYISEKRVYGTFEYIFENSLGFVMSNLRSYQTGANFNSSGKLEIDENILIELIINSLIHRDYYINSSIKIFMFPSRVEIISPGKLTNSLTVEKIKNGISIQRNPILDSIAKNILPYSGRGSGIKRAIALNPDIEFINDIEKEEFRCIIPRKQQEN